MPKYIEIANIIRERIKNNTYPKGSLLPNQTDFVEEFSVSRMTIKKALTILIMEGLLFSKRGAGTKVLTHTFSEQDTSPINDYLGLTHQMDKRNKKVSSQIIEFKQELPDEHIQDMLKIDADEPVYKIIRLRILDDRPYVLEHSYMPVHLVPGLDEKHLLGSIYHYIVSDLHQTFGGAYRTIQAGKSDAYDQKYLDCGVNDPVLINEQIVYNETGQPIDYSRSRNRYDIRGYSVLDVINKIAE